jgi:hypothetical protein
VGRLTARGAGGYGARMRAAGLFVVLLIMAPAAAQAGPPKVLTQRPHHMFQVRPAWIGYTGDGTGFIGGADGSGAAHPGHLHWRRYAHRQASARGVVWLNDCEPDCADGMFHSVPARVHVYRPRRGHFTRLTLKYRYRGHRYVDRRALRHTPGGDGYPGAWAWGFAG